MAAYVEQRVPAGERARLEAHLADCSACLEQVAFLVRRPEAPDSVVTPALLARARELVADRPRGWFVPVLRWGTAAVAACLVLLVGLELSRPGARPLSGAPVSGVAPLPDAARAATTVAPAPAVLPPAAARGAAARSASTPGSPANVRKSAATPVAVVLVAPEERATLPPGAPEFRWRAVPGALYYEVQVLSEEGNVVWQVTTEAPNTRLPDRHPLTAGTKYFVSVRAYLSGGVTVKSTAVSFRLGTR